MLLDKKYKIYNMLIEILIKQYIIQVLHWGIGKIYGKKKKKEAYTKENIDIFCFSVLICGFGIYKIR